MDAECKEMTQKVLARQLDGIMFHNDALLMHELFDDCPRLKRMHYRQMMDETADHIQTEIAIHEKYNEIVRPHTNTIRTKLVEDIDERPPSMLERKRIAEQIMTKWLNWEKETKAIYSAAYEKMPKFKMWKMLADDAEKEICYIEREMKHM